MIVLLVSLAILLVLSVPIAFALGTASAVYFVVYHPELIPVIPQRLFAGLNNYALIALPLFLLMGQLMNSSGITHRLIDFCLVFLGRFKGGLGLVNVGSSMIFGGISGSSTSDTASIGSVLIPEMTKRGFPVPFSTGLTVASSTMGMILPPSIPIVIFAVTAQESIGRLFLGGIIPGLMVGLFQGCVVLYLGLKNNYPTAEHHSHGIVKAFLTSLPILVMPMFLVGSVVAGVATATESAGLGVLYALFVGGFFLGGISRCELRKALVSAASTSANILAIIAFSQLFVWVLALERAPESMSQWVNSLNLGPTTFLLIFIGLLIVLGTVLDVSPAILLLTPVFLPAAQSAGVSPIVFGIVFVGTLAIGACTPPVGTCLNVGSLISKQPIGAIFKGAFPFLFGNLLMVLLVAVFPVLVLWLPNLLSD